MTDSQMLELYKLNVVIIEKPFKVSILLDKILEVVSKVAQERNYLQKDITALNEDLLYERKRIGRFMLSEKKLTDKIQLYENSIHINKNIYDLTRLPSRYALYEALNGTKQSLLYINIDHFDFINSIYGMNKANQILKECALKLNMFLPKNAELFHITADEFVILIDEPSVIQEVLLADQIHAFFKESPVEFEHYTHYIVFSIGIDSGENKIMFLNAKSASKEARYFGGDKTVVYSSASIYMQEQKENFRWIGILSKAFEEDRIFNYYQPIINNTNPQIKHYEVLCRLKSDDGSLVDAKNFIESAKVVGLITKITRTVIDKAFKVFAQNSYNFSINISITDFYEEYLLDFLEYKCNYYKVDRSRVYLEILEDVISSQKMEVDKQVIELKNCGYNVVIDDFASEKTMYRRMFDLQAKFIKINGSFIRELDKDTSYRIIVESIVEFAQKNGIKTMAEHIESEEVYKIVKELGIDYSQGYLLGKPSLEL